MAHFRLDSLRSGVRRDQVENLHGAQELRVHALYAQRLGARKVETLEVFDAHGAAGAELFLRFDLGRDELDRALLQRRKLLAYALRAERTHVELDDIGQRHVRFVDRAVNEVIQREAIPGAAQVTAAGDQRVCHLRVLDDLEYQSLRR